MLLIILGMFFKKSFPVVIPGNYINQRKWIVLRQIWIENQLIKFVWDVDV